MFNQSRTQIGFPLFLIFFLLCNLLIVQKVTISGLIDEFHIDLTYTKNSANGLISDLTMALYYGTFSLVINNEKPVLWNGYLKEGVSTA